MVILLVCFPKYKFWVNRLHIRYDTTRKVIFFIVSLVVVNNIIMSENKKSTFEISCLSFVLLLQVDQNAIARVSYV